MNLEDITYVVFDLETTGLNALEEDIIEIGAVKVKNHEIIDRFDELIRPGIIIPEKISEIMVKDASDCLTVLTKFLSFCGDSILVAHNAAFDLSFIKEAMQKYNLGHLNYDVIDTLGLSRFLRPYEKYHNLTILMQRYNIAWDENKHHRGDYDSEGTSYVLYKLIDEAKSKNIYNLNDLYFIPKIILNRKGRC